MNILVEFGKTLLIMLGSGVVFGILITATVMITTWIALKIRK